jgi:hypothetical protein
MTTTTTRRALLKAAPAAVALAAIPATASAASAPDRSKWDAAMRAFHRAKAEDDAFTPGYHQLWSRCDAALQAVPHITFPPEAYTGGRCQTTADAWQVREARRDIAAMDAGKLRLDPLPGLREHYAIKRELVKAADEREAAMLAINDQFGMDEADERWEALGEATCAARDALMDMPAPDLGALRWKLEQLPDPDGDMPAWTADFVRQTFADVTRLLPAES